MKNKVLLLLVSFLLVGCQNNDTERTFYISPTGDDANTGLQAAAAWKTLERVNQTTFEPGDAIRFESGGTWKGNLKPNGSGSPGKPITIATYGDGPRPIINIGKEEGAGISLNNQSWWEIEGMEITSGEPHQLGLRREGIVATAEGDAEMIEHIVIRDCYLHDIWGDVGGDKSGIAIYVGQRLLGVEAEQNCIANDILIENNTIRRVDKIGIAVNGDEQVIVRKNIIENTGGDGIIVLGAHRALVEYNYADRTCLRSGDPALNTGGQDWWPHTAAIWLYANTETIMQYNEVYNTGRQPANGDGFAYDFDFDCQRCILQYNYSANNHGFLLIMNRTSDNIARYNISQNDQTHLIQIHGYTEDRNLIHNNVFYVDHSTIDLDYYCGMENEKDINKLGVHFKNNIFYAGGQGRFRTVYSHGSAIDRQFNDSIHTSVLTDPPQFRNNCFFGPWLNGIPDDPQQVLKEPMLIEAGSGGWGLSSLRGYQLKPASPCIDKGAAIDSMGQHDYFGHPIGASTPDIGAFESTSKIN